MPPLTPTITAEAVRSRVRDFWKTFCNKEAAELLKFYDLHSVTFSVATQKTESGQIAATRRAREYFHPDATVHAEPGPIEVSLLGEAGASATYAFRLRVTQGPGGTEEKIDRIMPSVRATQVFRATPEGQLLIVQEHFSIAIQS